MPEFVASVVIDAPVERVFAFHERPDALELLTPKFPPVRVTRKSGGIQTGAQVDLRIGPIRWLAQHTAFERNQLFVDEQLQGPFAQWVHRHEFENLGKQTRLTDRVQYKLKGGAPVNAAFRRVVESMLRRMFAHRHRVTKEWNEGAGG